MGCGIIPSTCLACLSSTGGVAIPVVATELTIGAALPTYMMRNNLTTGLPLSLLGMGYEGAK